MRAARRAALRVIGIALLAVPSALTGQAAPKIFLLPGVGEGPSNWSSTISTLTGSGLTLGTIYAPALSTGDHLATQTSYLLSAYPTMDTTSIMIGHSNGGVLAAQHVADHPNTPALVMMSAHIGSTLIVPMMSKNGLFGRDRLPELIAQAEAMIAQGRGKELMLLPGWWWVISAESLVDYSRNMPSTLDNARRMKAPVLYVCGDKEPEDIYPAREFAARCSSPCQATILPNCDHFYTGLEGETAALVVGWIDKTLGAA